MTKLLPFILLLISSVLLISCTLPQSQSQQMVSLGSQSSLQLSDAPPELIGQQWQQILTFEREGQQQQLLTQLQITAAQGLHLVAMSAQGITLFELTQQGSGGYQVKHFLPVPEINANYILADIQLVHWPLLQLKKHLVNANIIATPTAQGMVRVVTQNNEKLISIDYQAQKTQLINHQRGYSLSFKKVTP